MSTYPRLALQHFLAWLAICVGMLALAFLASAQDSGPVNPSQGPPMNGWTDLYFYDGSGNLEYICHARSTEKVTSMAVTAATNATPIAVTVGENHGLRTGALVTIAGAQGNTAANGTFQIVVTGATTFTLKDRLTAANVAGNGTYAAGIATATTAAPRSNQAVWSIEKLVYSAGVLQAKGWIEGSTAAGTPAGKVCDNRASYGVQ